MMPTRLPSPVIVSFAGFNTALRATILSCLLPVVLLACSDDDSVVHPQPRLSIAGGEHEVAVASQYQAALRHTPGSRKREEDAAIEQLLSRAREDQRSSLLRALANPNARPMSAGDPETARLLRTIYEIRALDSDAGRIARSRTLAREHGIGVTVALVDRMPVANSRAMVLRRANAQPQDVILLPRGKATPTDLADATSVLFALRERFGDDLLADARVVVPARTKPARGGNLTTMKQRLGRLQKATPKVIDGLGSVPAIAIQLGPVKRGSPTG
jgi:hypothetical protein